MTPVAGPQLSDLQREAGDSSPQVWSRRSSRAGASEGGTGERTRPMQNDLPVHIGLPGLAKVDVEATFPAAGKRVVARMFNVDPRTPERRRLTIRIGGRQ